LTGVSRAARPTIERVPCYEPVDLAVDGYEPGATVRLSGPGTVSVHAAVRRSDQFTTHHHGEATHLAWLERPFAEALRALDERGRE
jgi:hypothetical protein